MKTKTTKFYTGQIHKICSITAFCVCFALLWNWTGCISNDGLFSSGSAATKQLGDLTGPWQLFVDDYLVEQKTNVVRTYHPFKKYPGNPVLTAEKPWEGTQVYVYGTVLPAEDGSGYRMWYHAWNGEYRNLYATSRDGINWEKPNLGLVSFQGSKENNIFFRLTREDHMPQVIHTPWEKDPKRRYKLMYHDYGRTPPHHLVTGFGGAYSPDGINWTLAPNSPVLLNADDVGNFVWDPHTKRYIGYPKIITPVRGYWRRCFGFTAAKDFENWPHAELILVPDEIDDSWVTEDKQHTDFYGLSGFAYESGYIGFLWIFRVTDGDNDGPIYCELVSSRDGINWIRQEPHNGQRIPILPNGPEGSWDAGTLVTINHPLVEGDTIKLWHSGRNLTHSQSGPNVSSGIGLATLRKDGFASLDTTTNISTVTTKPLKSMNGQLHVNANANDGWLKVEVLYANGKVVPGYSLDQCTPIVTDGVDIPVRWGKRKELSKSNKTMRLRFVMTKTSLYSFMAGEGVEVATPPVPLEAFFTFEGDSAKTATDKATKDGVQRILFHNDVNIIKDKSKAANGCFAAAFPFKSDTVNTLEILDTMHLGTKFTLAIMAKTYKQKVARLFSSFRGVGEPASGELIFDIHRANGILRFIVNGQKVQSMPRFYEDAQYHHFAVTYDHGDVKLYLDGNQVADSRIRPGSACLSWDGSIVDYLGSPQDDTLVGIHLASNLRVGNDLCGRFIQYRDELVATNEAYLTDFVDDILVTKRVLTANEIKALSNRRRKAQTKL